MSLKFGNADLYMFSSRFGMTGEVLYYDENGTNIVAPFGTFGVNLYATTAKGKRLKDVYIRATSPLKVEEGCFYENIGTVKRIVGVPNSAGISPTCYIIEGVRKVEAEE